MNHFSDSRFLYGWDDDDVTVGDLALAQWLPPEAQNSRGRRHAQTS